MHILPPSDPSSEPVPCISNCKIHEEFSGNDIEQLLHVIISVIPYLVPHSQIMDKWKEVMQIIQAEGAYIGHNHETLKNKVVMSECTALLSQRLDYRGVFDSGFSSCTAPTYYCRSEYFYSQCPQVWNLIRTECSLKRDEHRVNNKAS